MKVHILFTSEFIEWLNCLEAKARAQVDSRIIKIQAEAHFGEVRNIGNGLAELKWKNGRRVYFVRIFNPIGMSILLILGGEKNGQKNDIKKARVLAERYATWSY